MQAKLAGVGVWLTNTLVDCSELKTLKESEGASGYSWNQLQLQQDL